MKEVNGENITHIIPYVEEDDKTKKADLKVESLDDLFEEEPKREKRRKATK